MFKLTIVLVILNICLDFCLIKRAMTSEWCAMAIVSCAIAKVGAQRLSCRAQLQKLVRNGYRRVFNAYLVIW